jgi:TolA-binding protein
LVYQNQFDEVTSTVENFVWKMGTDTRALSVEIAKLDEQLSVEQEKIDELENHIAALQIDSATSLKRTDILFNRTVTSENALQTVMDAHALERSMNPCDPPPSISLPAAAEPVEGDRLQERTPLPLPP